jgi:hypothetical protein
MHCQATFNEDIRNMFHFGKIRHSHSPWSSPVNLVKTDGSLRTTIDYTALNACTVKDAYPLPLIEPIINQLTNAFGCSQGFFEYNVMSMGQCNSQATFQRLMDRVLHGLIETISFVYVDDIIIYCKTTEEHIQHVNTVVNRLREYNLKIKMKKCEIAQTENKYLSHVISNGTKSPNQAKVEALYRFQQPTNVKQVQSFLGLASFNRKYIENFANIASPLTQCATKKKFEWNDECQAAFDKLRKYVTTSNTDNGVLALPDPTIPF